MSGLLRLVSRKAKQVSAVNFVVVGPVHSSLAWVQLWPFDAHGLLVYCTPLHGGAGPVLQAEGGEDEPKKYKKANLGQSNQMYYSTEVGSAA